MTTLIRVEPSTPAARWWPTIQRRALGAIRQHAPDIPVRIFEAFLHDRWVKAPATLGAWVALRNDQLVAHALGWVEVAWGTPYLLLHHVIADAPVSDLREPFVAALRAWGSSLNACYAASGSPLRITKIEFWTGRHAGAMDRLLHHQSVTTSTVHTLALDLPSSMDIPRPEVPMLLTSQVR